MADIKFQIIDHIVNLGEPSQAGWVKQLNIIKWGDNVPRYDIRSWNSDHTKFSKGITLGESELQALVTATQGLPKDDRPEYF